MPEVRGPQDADAELRNAMRTVYGRKSLTLRDALEAQVASEFAYELMGRFGKESSRYFERGWKKFLPSIATARMEFIRWENSYYRFYDVDATIDSMYRAWLVLNMGYDPNFTPRKKVAVRNPLYGI